MLVRLVAGLVACAAVAACSPPPLVPLAPVDEPVVGVADPDVVPPIRLRGGDLVDAHGRVVLLRGVNSVRKEAPFISPLAPGWLGPLEREHLRASGFNVVRLGVTFAALVPEPGRIDEEYLARVVEVVDQLSADGFWIQLDFHQDVFHQMPAWATPADAWELSDEPPELLAFLGWAAGYLSPRSLRQWDSFLAGEPHVDGRSVAEVLGEAAGALAAAVADRPHVIGIELLNEPFSGSGVMRCIFDGCPDLERLLTERYEEMVAPIRDAAPGMPIWLEPFAPTAYVAQPTMPTPRIAPTPEGPQLGLAWHLYCHATDGGRVEQVDPATAGFCRLRMDNGFAAGRRLAESLGGPRILNEFGASANPLDVTLATRLADEQFVSWIHWHGAEARSATDSVLPDEVESQLVRPYPQATAGTPGELRYDPASGDFSYTFTPDPAIAAPTSIVVPARAYPTGYEVDVRNGVVTSGEAAGRVTVEADGSGRPVTVTLARAGG